MNKKKKKLPEIYLFILHHKPGFLIKNKSKKKEKKSCIIEIYFTHYQSSL